MVDEPEKKTEVKTWHKVAGVILVIAILGAVFSDDEDESGGTSKPKAAPAPGTAVVEEPSQPLPEWPADRLQAEFTENEIGAIDRFKSRALIVSGTVYGVDEGSFGGMSVMLDTGEMFSTMHCKLKKDQRSKAGQLRKGQRVRISGVVDSYFMGSVFLEDCVIQ